MPHIDKWGFWFKSIKAAVNWNIGLAILSATLFYVTELIPWVLLTDNILAAIIIRDFIRGSLIVLIAYYVLVAALATKIIYDEMVRIGKARAD